MNESPLNSALRHFEAAEANLARLEKLWASIKLEIPEGIVFIVDHPGYEDDCRSFESILASLPKIDGWKPEIFLMDLDQITLNRLSANDINEAEYIISVERQITEPGRLLREYRFRFNQKRRELIRDALIDLIDMIDNSLRELSTLLEGNAEIDEAVSDAKFDDLKNYVAQIDTLLGSSVARPQRWSDLYRHMRFGLLRDLHDIINSDWPSVKAELRKSLYGEKEPIPMEVDDLSSLVSSKLRGPVATRLGWSRLTADDFERLVFNLISSEREYENPEWLMKTNAPDRGRDLSVYRVHSDPLAGTIRQRVIIQCKHWLSKSISPTHIAELKEQMQMWEPPRVDVHIIATTGRFTSDAVSIVEKHNQSDSGLRIEMWPDSHLERLLASRPAIIAEFGLR